MYFDQKENYLVVNHLLNKKPPAKINLNIGNCSLHFLKTFNLKKR